jgi:UDP-glucose 4-epimerase
MKHSNVESNALSSLPPLPFYGSGQLPMTEDVVPQPEDPYGVSKCAVELDLKAAHELFGLNYVIFSPHNVYGENQNIGDKYRNVIGIFMNQNMQKKPLTIFGDGKQTRAFSYIDDVAIPIMESVHVPECYNQVFSIGADQPYTINELVDVVGKHFNVRPDVKHLRARKEVMHAYAEWRIGPKVLAAERATTTATLKSRNNFRTAGKLSDQWRRHRSA